MKFACNVNFKLSFVVAMQRGRKRRRRDAKHIKIAGAEHETFHKMKWKTLCIFPICSSYGHMMENIVHCIQYRHTLCKLSSESAIHHLIRIRRKNVSRTSHSL